MINRNKDFYIKPVSSYSLWHFFLFIDMNQYWSLNQVVLEITHEKCQSFEQGEINLLYSINVNERLVAYIPFIHMRDQSCGVNILVLEIHILAYCIIL